MLKKLLGLTKKPKELDASDKEWRDAFTKVLEELVPGEKFNIVAVKEETVTRFELHTESRRAMVAWTEVQEVLKPEIPNQINDLRSQ